MGMLSPSLPHLRLHPGEILPRCDARMGELRRTKDLRDARCNARCSVRLLLNAFLILFFATPAGDPAAGHARQYAGQHPARKVGRQRTQQILLPLGAQRSVTETLQVFQRVVAGTRFGSDRSQTGQQTDAGTIQPALQRAAARQAGRHRASGRHRRHPSLVRVDVPLQEAQHARGLLDLRVSRLVSDDRRSGALVRHHDSAAHQPLQLLHGASVFPLRRRGARCDIPQPGELPHELQPFLIGVGLVKKCVGRPIGVRRKHQRLGA